jgi:hypothetical protein
VPTGHVGILWKRFAAARRLDPGSCKDEGMRVLLPWDKLFLYDLRLQTTTTPINAISKGRREPQGDDRHPVPAEARRGASNFIRPSGPTT